jgi:hypothetical protein
MKSVLQQIAAVIKTPAVQAGVVSPGADAPPPPSQVTEEEEVKSNAGDPIEGDDAVAQTKATAKKLADGVLKTPVAQAGSLGATGSPPPPQVTDEEEVKSNAGDPSEGDDAIAWTKATAQELADAAAA